MKKETISHINKAVKYSAKTGLLALGIGFTSLFGYAGNEYRKDILDSSRNPIDRAKDVALVTMMLVYGIPTTCRIFKKAKDL